MSSRDSKQHWRGEIEFFDRIADQKIDSVRPYGTRTLKRYRKRRRAWLPVEQRFSVIGSVEGKRVLDVGCGGGKNAVILALLGGRVTGLDISPRSIALAEKRAVLNGVAERVSFICGPVEHAEFAPGSFDVIWCDGFLHHVRDELAAVLARFNEWCAPDGVIMISEPVSLSDTMRRLRLALLPPPVATEHEGPLDRQEVAQTSTAFSHVGARYYGLFGRLEPFVLTRGNFEYSSLPRRWLALALRLIDVPVLSLPVLRALASQVVMRASPRHADPLNTGIAATTATAADRGPDAPRDFDTE
jgi:2-polyprenyl-3-methyl-5-hydroxy-6-metoxy-1,4-benzoquinol methylase